MIPGIVASQNMSTVTGGGYDGSGSIGSFVGNYLYKISGYAGNYKSLAYTINPETNQIIDIYQPYYTSIYNDFSESYVDLDCEIKFIDGDFAICTADDDKSVLILPYRKNENILPESEWKSAPHVIAGIDATIIKQPIFSGESSSSSSLVPIMAGNGKFLILHNVYRSETSSVAHINIVDFAKPDAWDITSVNVDLSSLFITGFFLYNQDQVAAIDFNNNKAGVSMFYNLSGSYQTLCVELNLETLTVTAKHIMAANVTGDAIDTVHQLSPLSAFDSDTDNIFYAGQVVIKNPSDTGAKEQGITSGNGYIATVFGGWNSDFSEFTPYSVGSSTYSSRTLDTNNRTTYEDWSSATFYDVPTMVSDKLAEFDITVDSGDVLTPSTIESFYV